MKERSHKRSLQLNMSSSDLFFNKKSRCAARRIVMNFLKRRCAAENKEEEEYKKTPWRAHKAELKKTMIRKPYSKTKKTHNPQRENVVDGIFMPHRRAMNKLHV